MSRPWTPTWGIYSAASGVSSVNVLSEIEADHQSLGYVSEYLWCSPSLAHMRLLYIYICVTIYYIYIHIWQITWYHAYQGSNSIWHIQWLDDHMALIGGDSHVRSYETLNIREKACLVCGGGAGATSTSDSHYLALHGGSWIELFLSNIGSCPYSDRVELI